MPRGKASQKTAPLAPSHATPFFSHRKNPSPPLRGQELWAGFPQRLRPPKGIYPHRRLGTFLRELCKDRQKVTLVICLHYCTRMTVPFSSRWSENKRDYGLAYRLSHCLVTPAPFFTAWDAYVLGGAIAKARGTTIGPAPPTGPPLRVLPLVSRLTKVHCGPGLCPADPAAWVPSLPPPCSRQHLWDAPPSISPSRGAQGKFCSFGSRGTQNL